MEATFLDLRRRMRDVLHALDLGQSVTILYRGKKKARLVPIGGPLQDRPRPGEQPAFGIWADRDDIGDVDAFVRSIREGRIRAR